MKEGIRSFSLAAQRMLKQFYFLVGEGFAKRALPLPDAAMGKNMKLQKIASISADFILLSVFFLAGDLWERLLTFPSP